MLVIESVLSLLNEVAASAITVSSDQQPIGSKYSSVSQVPKSLKYPSVLVFFRYPSTQNILVSLVPTCTQLAPKCFTTPRVT